jgi:hypothetical protein
LLDQAETIIQQDIARRKAGEEVVVRISDDWKYDKRLVNVLPSSFGSSISGRSFPRLMGALTGGIRHTTLRSYDRAVGTGGRISESHTGMEWVTMTPEQADATEALCEYLAEFCIELVERAERRATSFLVRVASGEVSVNELNEHAMARPEPKRR